MINERLQGGKIPSVDEVVLVDDTHEVLKAVIHVLLDAHGTQLIKVAVVQMCVHTEEALEYLLYTEPKSSWKRHTELLREDALII